MTAQQMDSLTQSHWDASCDDAAHAVVDAFEESGFSLDEAKRSDILYRINDAIAAIMAEACQS